MRVLPFVRRPFVFLLALAVMPQLHAAPHASPRSPQASGVAAQGRPFAQGNRVAADADFAPRTQMLHHLPAWVHAASQLPVSVAQTDRLQVSVVLRRDDVVQAAFEQLLTDQQNPASPCYHQWLTPTQVGALYGPTASDLAAVQQWLTSEGLTVDAVQPNHVILDVSGTVAQLSSAFRTSFAMFQLNGQQRLSAISDPSVPTALLPVIQSVSGLTEVRHVPHSHRVVGTGTDAPAVQAGDRAARPQLTTSGGSHFMMPGDFNTIYDVASVLAQGNNGATIGSKTQKVAIVARSRVASTDISEFEVRANMPALQPVVVLGGVDPGTTGDGNQDEATLDVERVLGTAPGVEADLVVAASTRTADGVYTSAAYNVNTLLDPIMTLSFGSCESDAGSGDSATYTALFSAAAAEGIATFVSSGDSGADGCFSAGTAGQTGLPSSNDLCNAYVTCVGGTQFVEGAGAYWNTSNGTGYVSALSYIPEGAWNEPSSPNSSGGTTYVMASTGGGPSIYIARPSWQIGTGVPIGTFRETPDISFAAAGHDGYFSCLAYAGATCVSDSTGKFSFIYFSGTSASAPSMAAVAALLNTKTGKAQGPLNPLLYRLASLSNNGGVFHDVTVPTSAVSGCTAATPSVCNNSTPGATGLTGGISGFVVGPGYDDVTGLGSLDVANFLTAAAVATTPTTIAVVAAPSPAIINAPVTLTATVSPASVGTAAPSGTVTFASGGVSIGSGPLAVSGSNYVATLTHTFTAAATNSLTATYSGDANYSASTSAAVSLVVSSQYTLTPATTSFGVTSTLVSGTSVTDAIALASNAPFAGNVALSCVVTKPSSTDTAAGTCSVTPGTANLASAGAATATLTINTVAGTSGTLNVVVNGDSGGVTTPSGIITVKLTASSFTISPTPGPATVSVLGGGVASSTLTVTSVNGFVGNVALTCAASPTATGGTASGTCSVSPTSVTLASGGSATTTATITTQSLTAGTLNVVVSGNGTTAGASLPSSTACGTSTLPCIQVTEPQPFTLAPSSSSLTFASGASTGNSATITVSPVTGFSGTVSFTCAVSVVSGSPAYPATCAVSPTSVAVASGPATTTLTINSHAPVTQAATGVSSAGVARLGLGALLAVCAFWPWRRRRQARGLPHLAVAVLALAGLTALAGCSGGSTKTPTTPVTTSSAGNYSVVVTGSDGNVQASTTVSVVIQ